MVVCPEKVRLGWGVDAIRFFPNYFKGRTLELGGDSEYQKLDEEELIQGYRPLD